MRKLFILLLLIPIVSAHHPVFDETGFVESELPVVYSNKFSLSEVDISLEGDSHFNLEIINEGPESLFLIINYPDFLSGEEQIEIGEIYTLEVKVDNSRNSYGLIEFQAPEASLFLPVIHTLKDDNEFDKFDLNPSADVYFAGEDMTFNVEITDDDSGVTKKVYLTFTLLAKDGSIVLEDSKIVDVDALFDEELSLYLPEYLSKGDYVLFVESKYNGFSEYDSSLFTLDEKKMFSYWIYALFILIIGLFIFLIYNSHKHLSILKKIHTKHSLSIKKHHASRAKVELVEKKLSSIRSAYLEGAISKKNYDITVKKLREKIKQLRDSVKRGPK
jgi:hypothetical protein